MQVLMFSKHLQEYNVAQMGDIVAQMGFEGIDLTVRPGGHILPERVKEELRENTGHLRYVYKMKEFQELGMLSPVKIYKIRPPIKIFSSVAPSASFEIGGTDVDGTVRTLPLFIKEEWAVENKLTSGFLPHMDVLGYAIYLGQDPMRPSLVVDFKRRVVEIKEGLKTYHYVPFDSMGLFHIYYYGKGEEVFKTVSFYDVYTGKFDPKDFKGKIVVIGYTATAKGLYDLRITPFSNNEPGVYIHATAIENIIRDAVVDVDPFTVKLRGAGVFPNQNYIRVIWIGIEDGDIIKIIAGRIDERLSELGFQREKREFSPHVTIARVKTAKKREDLMNVIRRYTDTSFKVFNVEAVALKKSVLTKEGAVYTTISKIKI